LPEKRKKDVAVCTSHDTVFIDLRYFENRQQQQLSSVERVQKVLGIVPTLTE